MQLFATFLIFACNFLQLFRFLHATFATFSIFACYFSQLFRFFHAKLVVSSLSQSKVRINATFSLCYCNKNLPYLSPTRYNCHYYISLVSQDLAQQKFLNFLFLVAILNVFFCYAPPLVRNCVIRTL